MTAWILSLLLLVAPPGLVPSRESAGAGRVRYETIAADISAVVSEEAPLFAGEHGREQTAALLVSVAYYESAFRLDVDTGANRGDGGRSCTLWQMQRGRAECDRLVTNRREAAREAIRLVRRSMLACASHPMLERLAAYASGSCGAGLEASRLRMRKARRLFDSHPIGGTP